MEFAARFAPHEALAAALLPDLPGGDGAHDIAHILRVWANVQTIAKTEGGDLRILAAATLLHDAVPVEKNAPNRAKASRLAAERASAVLQGLSWPKADITATAHAIAAHSFSANIRPETLEARILQDADRLEALGAIGIARCFYVSGRLGRALYDPADPMADDRPPDDSRFTLDHFKTKLLRLKDGFQTETARQMAQGRHKKLENFLSELMSEISTPTAD